MTRLLPERVNLYVAAVTIVGVAVIGTSAVGLASTPNMLQWGGLTLLAIVTGRFPLRVPGSTAWFSLSDTFFITSALLFGPAPATVALAVDSLIMSYGRTVRLRRFLFNGSAPAIALWAGAQVFFLLSGTGPLYYSSVSADVLVLPLACFAGIYYLLNSGLTAVALGFDKNISAIQVWRSHFMTVSLSYFAAASVAYLLVLLSAYLNIFALVAVLPLLAVINLAMRSWTGRIDDAEKHVAAVDRLYLSTIEALSTAIEAKDGVTSSHIHRVQHYAMGLARALGLKDPDTLKAIQAAALLHDTGKLAVPERILNKPGKLTAAEYETMKLHVDVGADILSSIDFPYPVVPIVRAHHENWDGTGYPRGLRGSDIPIGARILSIVDCYDALTSDRPYRAAMSDQQALQIIRTRRGSMYDPTVVDVFERVCRDITPDAVTPQLQKALQQISKAVEAAPALVPVAAPVAAPIAEGPEALMALVNLARIVDGGPSVTDVASVAWSQIRHIVPGASCGVFLTDSATDSIQARFVAGPASAVLQGLQMRVGERLTGWVAVNGQTIVNSEATLDLGQAAVLAGLSYCLAVPMQNGSADAIGVLSIYSGEPFRDDQAQLIQRVGPYLAQMLTAASAPADAAAKASPVKPRAASLRIV